jgi:hypothetical protein
MVTSDSNIPVISRNKEWKGSYHPMISGWLSYGTVNKTNSNYITGSDIADQSTSSTNPVLVS